jgi:hypothetical protein
MPSAPGLKRALRNVSRPTGTGKMRLSTHPQAESVASSHSGAAGISSNQFHSHFLPHATLTMIFVQTQRFQFQTRLGLLFDIVFISSQCAFESCIVLESLLYRRLASHSTGHYPKPLPCPTIPVADSS